MLLMGDTLLSALLTIFLNIEVYMFRSDKTVILLESCQSNMTDLADENDGGRPYESVSVKKGELSQRSRKLFYYRHCNLMLQTASHQSMEVTNEIPTAGTSNSNERMNQRDKTPRPPRNRFRNAQRSTGSPTGRTNGDQASSNRPITPPRGDANTTVRSGSSNIGSGVPPVTGSEGVPAPRKRNPRKRNPVQTPADTPESSNTERSKDGGGTRQNRLAGGERGTRRGAKFNAGLTDPSSTAHNQSTDKPANRYRNKAHTINPLPTDLASTLIQALRTPPYPDCPICFSSIHPAQRTWSCSPSIPVIRPADAESDEQQYCWTTFHVKCIGEWASKSVTEVAKAWRARGEEGKKGDWRCPGCQAKREIVPSGYWCVMFRYVFAESLLTSSYIGVFAILLQNPSPRVWQPLILVQIHALVFAKAGAGMHAHWHATLDHVHLVR